jgi:hypothetical protein
MGTRSRRKWEYIQVTLRGGFGKSQLQMYGSIETPSCVLTKRKRGGISRVKKVVGAVLLEFESSGTGTGANPGHQGPLCSENEIAEEWTFPHGVVLDIGTYIPLAFN